MLDPSQIERIDELTSERRRKLGRQLAMDPETAGHVIDILGDRMKRHKFEAKKNERIAKVHGEANEELSKLLEKLTEGPHPVACVVAPNNNGTCFVAVGSSRQEVAVHPDLCGQTFSVGDLVLLSSDRNVVLKRAEDYQPGGRVVLVTAVRGDHVVVNDVNDQRLMVPASPAVLTKGLKEGDEVVCSDEWKIVTEVFSRHEETTLGTDFDPVTWDQIGGLDETIDELRSYVTTQLLYPERSRELFLTPPKGMTLHGPPGVGKTFLAKALATSLREDFGRRVIFHAVPPGGWRTSFYGESEKKIVAPLREARRLLDEDRVDMVVLFYDELDSLGVRSSDVTNHIDSRVMVSFLAELDGLVGRDGVLVIGATNRLDMVDEALLRPQRFGDLTLQVQRPDRDASRAIFRCHLDPQTKWWTNGKAHSGSEMVERCIDAATPALFADADEEDALVRLVLQNGNRRPLFAADVASGAMIANVVRRAKRAALKRSCHGPLGLAPEDLVDAVDDELDAAAARLTEPGKVREVLGEHQLPVVRIEPVRLQ